MSPPKKKQPKKKQPKSRRDGRGRPSIDFPEYYKKILPYLKDGLSLTSACRLAKVPHQTVSDYLKKPEFAEYSAEIEYVRNQGLIDMARSNLATAIRAGKPLWVSTWFLERKCRQEFATRVVNTNENSNCEVVIQLPSNGREKKCQKSSNPSPDSKRSS